MSSFQNSFPSVMAKALSVESDIRGGSESVSTDCHSLHSLKSCHICLFPSAKVQADQSPMGSFFLSDLAVLGLLET